MALISRLRLLVGYIVVVLTGELLLWLIRRTLVSSHRTGSKLRRIQVLIVLEFLMSLGSIMIWFRCSQLLTVPVRKKSVNIIDAARLISKKDMVNSGLILFLFFTHICYVLYYVLLSEEPHLLAIISFSCTGAFIYLTGFLFTFSIWEFIVLISLRYSDSLREYARGLFQVHPRFRALILGSRFHTLVSLILALLFTGFGLYAGFAPPKVVHQTVFLNNLPGAFDGFNITLLTDIHIGPTVGRNSVKQAVDIVNSLKSDLVAIAGDLVDGSVEKLYLAADPLKNLKSRHGVYFSSGNHEYYYGDVNEWFQHLETLGVRPLHNSHVKIRHPDVPSAYFCFAGVDDVFSEKSGVPGHRMDVGGALAGCDRRKLVIMMVHQPNGAKKVLDGPDGYAVDLVLSGHTHGGQIYILAPLAYFSQAYYLGLYKHSSESQIYVSAGLNFFGPPLKMYGFREITQLTLRKQR